jgi:hypothetical protein
VWATNSDWGALRNGQTLHQACQHEWEKANCGRTCCYSGAYADTWAADWGASPYERCETWSTNSAWGALANGQTLHQACQSDWAKWACAGTCSWRRRQAKLEVCEAKVEQLEVCEAEVDQLKDTFVWLPPPSPPTGNPCRCKAMWYCPDRHHYLDTQYGCEPIPCDGDEGGPWCKVENPGCDEQEPGVAWGSWAYCNPN